MIVFQTRQVGVDDFFLFRGFDFLGRQQLSREDSLGCIIVDAREVEFLEWVEVHRLGEYTEFHRLQVLWTFRDDHDVGSVLSAQRLTQSSCREHLVVDDESVVIYQQDVDAWFYVAMLESIVEQYHIHI